MNLAAFAMAALGGAAIGTQAMLNGALGRNRGILETIFVSISVSYAAVVLLMGLKAARVPPLGLPFHARSVIAVAGACLLAALTLTLVGRDIAPWYFSAGLLGLVVLFAGTFATPVLGVGLTAATLTAGQIGVGLLWDQLGLLGLPEVPVTPQRLVGMLLVIGGVVLVRAR